VAQEDLVEVEREDVALREVPLEAPRQDRLADLPLQRSSEVRNDFATCCVMVEPPCATTPARRLAVSARPMPR
jgi:hypothetical protein